MNVPKLPFLEKKNKTEYFLSLVLRDEKAGAVIFEEVNGKVNVIGEHEEHFKTSIEDATEEELLQVLDKAVSTAEHNLPPDAESHKTIFGVKQDWISEGKIKKDYLSKLKKISDELTFQPMGFLVIPEAIAHLMQKEEGAPLNAILVEVGQKSLTVSLFKAGRMVETKSGVVEGKLSDSVEDLLQHFTTTEILPSRVILFDGGREKLQQEFISHKWNKDLPFLHVPQVINLPANFDARAVLNGAATQMGFDVLEGSLIKAAREDKNLDVDALSVAVDESEDKTIEEVAQEFGFTSGDVKVKGKKIVVDDSGVEPEPGVKIEPKTAVDENLTNANIAAAQFREIPEEVKLRTTDKKQLPINAALLTNAIRSFASKIHIGGLIRGIGGSRKKLLILGIPVILIVSIVFIYVFVKTATITLTIASKNVDKSENVTFSQSEATSANNNVIRAQFLSVSEDGKKSTTATGKKQTGEKAKGTVTMFNSDTSGGVTIPTGTTITSSNNLNFLTDKAVTVASASGDIFSGTKPGTANIAVTAEKFGTNYNLPSGSKFTVENHANVAAKNDSAFSGGTVKNIQVIAKADQDKLATGLQKQLESEAKDDIKKKATRDSIVLPNFISVSFDHKSFSKKIGDEGSDVTLTATISYKGISYKRDEINSFVTDKLKSESDKLTVNPDSIVVSATSIKQKDKNATAKLNIKAGLIPQIDEKGLANQLKGRSVGDAKTKLQTIPQVDNVDINIFPPIPLLPNLLPFSSGKIKFVINKNG